MRLSGFTLAGLLVTLALVAFLMMDLLGSTNTLTSGAGTGGSAATTQGSLGGFANAISNAQQSAAQQNAAASQASQTSAP